jgi:hypothetical protein
VIQYSQLFASSPIFEKPFAAGGRKKTAKRWDK